MLNNYSGANTVKLMYFSLNRTRKNHDQKIMISQYFLKNTLCFIFPLVSFRNAANKYKCWLPKWASILIVVRDGTANHKVID